MTLKDTDDGPETTDAEELAEWMGDTDHAHDLGTDSLTRHEFMNILLWRIGDGQRKLDRWRKLVDAQRKMTEDWYVRKARTVTVRIQEARRQIDGLMRAEHTADPKILTLEVPNGTVTYREPPVASLVVDDEEMAVAWLKARGVKATRLIEVVAKAELKKLAEPTGMDRPEGADPALVYSRVAVDGEIVPGVHYERQAQATVTAKPR